MFRIKSAVVHIFALGLLGLSGLLGIFAAFGVCAMIWGPKILITALGNPPCRSHPAFWLGLLIMIPSMIVGVVGGLFTFTFPIYAYFDVRIFNTGPNDKRLVAFYIRL